MKRIVFLLSLVLCGTAAAVPTDNLQPVGTTTLKVMFLKLYDSSLYTESGAYTGVGSNMALKLRYHRDIPSQNLVSATRKEWQRQGLYEGEDSESWLKELLSMWPDIKLNDELLVFSNDEMHSEFYHNGRYLGRIEDPAFTRNFLLIWLSPDTRFPRERARLVGTAS